MAEENHQQQGAGVEADPEDGPSESKKPRLEETDAADTAQPAAATSASRSVEEVSGSQEPRDPGKKQYRELNKQVRQLKALVSKPEEERKGEDVISRMRDCIKKVENLSTSAVCDGEVPNPMKIVQMHMKHVLFNSEKVKDGDNIKNFLNGLEDGSSSTSDKDSSVFVFLANFATELWYSWSDSEAEWQWTPEKWTEERKWWLWMSCSTTVVTDGQWKDETPAPENVEIINYLDAVRPVPSDEQYLSQNFDMVDLLKKLLEVGDDQVSGSVKVVLQSISDQEVVSNNGQLSSFLEEMSSLLKKLSVDH